MPWAQYFGLGVTKGLHVTLNVYDYTDYRRFLHDFYTMKKQASRAFSYRRICDRVGIKSTGHFTLILQGKANVSIPLALKLAAFLGLRKRETDYFQYLVLFNQARSHEDKRMYFEKMASFRESRLHLVNAEQYEYYAKWYHSVIRALLEFVPFDGGDCGVLAKLLDPPVPATEVRKSFDLLKRLGMVERDDGGMWRPTDAVIDTGSPVDSLAVERYVLNTLSLAREAIDRFAGDERKFSWVTFGVSRTGYEAILKEAREFRRRIYRIVESEAADRVYQMNMQIFPVSRPHDDRKADL